MLRFSIQTTSVITYAEIKIQQALVSLRNGNSHRYENIFHCAKKREETARKKDASAHQ